MYNHISRELLYLNVWTFTSGTDNTQATWLFTLRIFYFPPLDFACSSTAHQRVWNYKIYILTT